MRAVVIDAEQAAIIEEIGERMMREHDDRAFKVLAVALAYKFAAPREFHCDIDESAGMAEVVDIRDRINAYGGEEQAVPAIGPPPTKPGTACS